MTPLFGCVPVCLTFVAIGFVGLVVVLVVGTNKEGPNAPGPDREAPPGVGVASGAPPGWVIVLIFVIVLLHFALLLWVWPEL